MEEYLAQCDKMMDKAIDSLKEGLKTIRSGVVSPNVLDKIYVNYYGEKTPIKSLASISATSATQLVIRPYDPSALKEIVGAIGESDLGVNPVVNGAAVYLSFPALTGERRQEFVKQAKVMADQAKITVRNIRGDIIGKVKKDKTLSKDMVFNLNDDIQKSTDKHNKMVDAIFAAKEKELLTL